MRTALALAVGTVAFACACGGSGHATGTTQTPGPASSTNGPPATSTASGTTAPASAGGPCGTAPAGSASYAHVIVVVMENHGFHQVDGASPYLNGLAASCGLATSYRAVTHPSLPNYLALTSGATGGLDGLDCEPGPSCSTSAPSVFGQTSWRVYADAMPGPCAGNGAGDYAPRHNPPLYYTAPAVTAACAADDLPLADGSGLHRALAHPSALPHFMMLIPDLCHDEHDCPIASGDAWLARQIPPILRSAAYRDGSTLLVVTYDEDDHGEGNQVYTVVVSPTTAPGTRSGRPFTHASLARTVDELLGLPLLPAVRGAASMRAAFGL